MTSPFVEIREASFDDISQIVNIHTEAFEGFYLTSLGPRFLAANYRAILEHPESIFLIAVRNGKALGFVSGFGNPPDFALHYRSKRFKLSLLVMSAVLRRPSLLRRTIFNVRRVSRPPDGSSRDVELASFAVRQSEIGKGVGGQLHDRFVNIAHDRGYRSLYLTTDARNNDHVNDLYARKGWVKEREFYSGNRPMLFWTFWLEEVSGR